MSDYGVAGRGNFCVGEYKAKESTRLEIVVVPTKRISNPESGNNLHKAKRY